MLCSLVLHELYIPCNLLYNSTHMQLSKSNIIVLQAQSVCHCSLLSCCFGLAFPSSSRAILNEARDIIEDRTGKDYTSAARPSDSFNGLEASARSAPTFPLCAFGRHEELGRKGLIHGERRQRHVACSWDRSP